MQWHLDSVVDQLHHSLALALPGGHDALARGMQIGGLHRDLLESRLELDGESRIVDGQPRLRSQSREQLFLLRPQTLAVRRRHCDLADLFGRDTSPASRTRTA